jgi:hypothetical protein
MIGAVTQGLQGLTGIASGIIGGGKRRAEQRAAEKELAINKARYENLDTSNLAANMENTFEDLTVNTQAADMAMQQQNQALANTMGGMNAAAGGSGIAALAQIQGAQNARDAEAAKTETLLGMSQSRLAAANEARAAATKSITDGIGNVMGGAMEVAAAGGFGGKAGGAMDKIKGFLGG